MGKLKGKKPLWQSEARKRRREREKGMLLTLEVVQVAIERLRAQQEDYVGLSDAAYYKGLDLVTELSESGGTEEGTGTMLNRVTIDYKTQKFIAK